MTSRLDIRYDTHFLHTCQVGVYKSSDLGTMEGTRNEPFDAGIIADAGTQVEMCQFLCQFLLLFGALACPNVPKGALSRLELVCKWFILRVFRSSDRAAF
jgi:hypothetical protein